MSLNPSNYKLSPQLLDEMLDNDYRKGPGHFATIYDQTNKKSPEQMTHEALNNLQLSLSEPLKKMHTTYLARVTKNCYNEKHLADDFPNEAQVEHCKKVTYDKIFGDFEEKTHNLRRTDAYKFQKCLHDAENQLARIDR